MLVESKVVIGEDELNITDDDLTCLALETVDHFDGFGLLQIMHTTDIVGAMEKSYCFLHRAVQELLAAFYIWKEDQIEDAIDQHFKRWCTELGVAKQFKMRETLFKKNAH